jgi:transcriptional regulator with XRE-family HTH domain
MLYDNAKIKKLREAKKLSINELGRRAGISGPSMHAIETGKTKKIVHSTLVGIANALGVSMQEILKAGNKTGPKEEMLIEAMAAYSKLSPTNQQAMLAAIRSLLDKQ